MPWTVYILECADKTLYTGITKDMAERLGKHTKGTGAKYTRGRGPFRVFYTETCRTKSRALKREAEIKGLGRNQKLTLGVNKSPSPPRRRGSILTGGAHGFPPSRE